jgi:hypothetical protein
MKQTPRKTTLQREFEKQTPSAKNLKGIKYLQVYCSWLEFQINKKQK